MSGKIGPSHLQRRAYVYVRQSTTAQVFEHGESTARQYALAERAQALGWAPEAVEVIDEDLGRSGKSAEGRSGFHALAEAVAHDQAGAILAIEVSRLARCSQDWQRLLSLCAVAEVVVIDEHAVYDPGDGDDKLLLDLKGTMSEAELHWLGLRLAGARHNKARRGVLRLPAPAGYVWGRDGYELDPDEAVQRAIHVLFERFAVEPSGWSVIRWAEETGFKVPTRRSRREGLGEVEWKPLRVSRLNNILHNPVYAGVYAYGRYKHKKILVKGEIRTVRRFGLDPDSWSVRIEDAHPRYITWETYLSNQRKLRNNGTHAGCAGRAPREGPALLTGLLICGRCGRPMSTRYWGSTSRKWSYSCPGQRAHGGPTCWSVVGEPIDLSVENLLLETVVPDELELCLAVEREAEQQAASLGEQWRLRIEQADYEARLAERRYKAVDPDNRVVARTLETQWEQCLRELEEVRRQYEDARRQHRVDLTEQDRARIRALARDLPAVWKAPTTKSAERKAMLRMVIEAVSLHPVDVPRRETLVRVQWHSGVVTELRVDRRTRGSNRRTSPEAIERIRQLVAEDLHDELVAQRLNAEGLRTGAGKSWNLWAVRWARKRNAISRPGSQRSFPPLPDRHPDGSYSIRGAARRFGVTREVVRGWIRRGEVDARRGDFGRYHNVWWLRLDEAEATRLKARGGRKPPGRSILPARHRDGRYSLPGAARAFDVSRYTLRQWIDLGLIDATREDYGGHPNVWWLDLDDEKVKRLKADGVGPAHRRPPLPDRHPDGRFSAAGAARYVGVTAETVRRWIHQGLVAATREDLGEHRHVWWLANDHTVSQFLDDAVKRTVRRTRTRTKASETKHL